jgi:malate-CoA ligase subunit beta
MWKKPRTSSRNFTWGWCWTGRAERIMVVASAEGGMEIEELSEKHPDAILRMTIDPATGFLEYQARELAFGLGLQSGQVAQAAKIFRACYRAFRDLDATMVEINPLIVTAKGELMALDAKMSFDDNALFRHQDVLNCAT